MADSKKKYSAIPDSSEPDCASSQAVLEESASEPISDAVYISETWFEEDRKTKLQEMVDAGLGMVKIMKFVGGIAFAIICFPVAIAYEASKRSKVQ